jgi:glutamyl-tRNA reductase
VSLLVVGISHRSAPVRVLERAVVSNADVAKLLDELLHCQDVSEALLLSTCNRVEVYATVETFHGGLAEVSGVLARHAGAEVAELADYLYVHYAAAAVEHLFSLACGLDSMVVGESQILGQLRAAYAVADAAGTVGRTLHELAQNALRVGKRVHAETEIDHAGASVVSEALADAASVLGAPGSFTEPHGALAGTRALLVGAGSMAGLSAAHLRRAGVSCLTVVNRSSAGAVRLAEAARAEGTQAAAVGLGQLAIELADADVVVACTAAAETVITRETVLAALAGRAATRHLVICDLGMPRNVEASVGQLPGVTVVDLETLRNRLCDAPTGLDEQQARRLVAEEVRAYLAAQRSAEVTPTVTALRRRAAEVIDGELLRLDSRLPDLAPAVRDELARTVRRVVDKLLHAPTVRIKQFASAPGGTSYADALRELFELDPQVPAVVSAPGNVETGQSGHATRGVIDQKKLDGGDR